MVRRHQPLSVSLLKTVCLKLCGALSVIRPLTLTDLPGALQSGHSLFLVIMSVRLLVTIVHLQRLITQLTFEKGNIYFHCPKDAG